MSKLTPRIGCALALALAMATVPQTALADDVWQRLGGADRYETMSAIVSEGFSSASRAVVATGQNFPDALTASSFAGAMNAPVILTASDHLSDAARRELQELNVREVIILGGEAAVSLGVEQEIAGMGITCGRVAGADRFETALGTMRLTREAGSTSNTVIVATGTTYPDSLSIGPWAYATKSPIVLVDGSGRLSNAAVEAIEADRHIKNVVIVGGTSVVSDAVKSQLTGSYYFERVAGGDRYATSAEIARWEIELGFNWRSPSFTTGRNYPDALSAAPLAGRMNSPVLLSDADNSQGAELLYNKRYQIAQGYLLGGTSVVRTSDPVASFAPHRRTLDGVDISGWDQGVDVSALDGDFVIIKVTEGLQLSRDNVLYNPWYADWADEVLASGKLLGFYHYANGEDPVQEADEFYEAVKDYRGKALLCLDWEGDGNPAFDTEVDVNWCLIFLKRIQDRFGGTPMLYTSKNEVEKYDFSEVASKFPLWGAEYPDDEDVLGYDGEPWQSEREWGAWGADPLVFQYTGTGKLPFDGYESHFDLNLFHGTRADWLRYQGSGSGTSGTLSISSR